MKRLSLISRFRPLYHYLLLLVILIGLNLISTSLSSEVIFRNDSLVDKDPKVMSVRIDKGKSDKDSIVKTYGTLTVTVAAFEVKPDEKVFLVLGGVLLEDIEGTSDLKDQYRFELNPRSLNTTFDRVKLEEGVYVSISKKNGEALPSGSKIKIAFIGRTWSWLIPLLLILVILAVTTTTGLIKDATGKYSLSRLVLFSWTLVIAASLLYIGLATGVILTPNQTVLALLAIPGATFLGAKTVKKDVQPESGLLNTSALSSGTTKTAQIHRLQAVIFNFMYMGYFLYEGFSNLFQPEFDENTFLLLGISNSVYVGMKINE